MSFLTDDEARALYQAGDAAHDFDHIWRVTTLAIRLAQREGADETVVRLAALLHDVPAPEDEEPKDNAEERTDVDGRRKAHHLVAAEYAGKLLAARGLGTE